MFQYLFKFCCNQQFIWVIYCFFSQVFKQILAFLFTFFYEFPWLFHLSPLFFCLCTSFFPFLCSLSNLDTFWRVNQRLDLFLAVQLDWLQLFWPLKLHPFWWLHWFNRIHNFPFVLYLWLLYDKSVE
jgi:hypothetical protein